MSINRKGHEIYWDTIEELKIDLASRGMYMNTIDYAKIPLMDIYEMLGKPKNIPVGIENEGESKHHSYLQYIKTFST